MSADTVEELLPDLARQFAAAAEADLVAVRLREGDQVLTRATYGLEPGNEVAHGKSIEMLERFEQSRPIEVDAAHPEDEPVGPVALSDAIPAAYALPLRDRDGIAGTILIGWRKPTTLGEGQRELLTAMAAPVGGSIAKLEAIAERDQAIAKAERALALRDEILGVVAHDLRNPLNVITTAVELLQTKLTEPSQKRHLDRVVRSVQRADRLVRDLLEVNAIEGSGLTIDKRPVEVVEVVLQAIESQHMLAANASVVLGTDLSPALPTVLADELRIQEVLENLISNAIKFTPQGGTVVIGAAPMDDALKIWVRDTGAGIPADHLPHVFDRFWQGIKRDRRGAGLGLSICRAIIDAHGGRIWADSTHGQGATLSFTLPVASKIERPVVAARSANLLLVDDRPENLVALGAILEDPRYHLVSCTSGTEALREALRVDFSIALIDVAMPMMDGLEVAGHLKKLSRYRDLPIIFVTAFGDDPEEIHRAYAAGGADYIVKPLDPEVVRKKVAVFVELAQRNRPPT